MNCDNPHNYKHFKLSNQLLDIEVLLPDDKNSYYKAARFDYSGMISKITSQNHSFIEPWIAPHNPTDPEHGIGTAEEFSEPLGYEQITAGGEFIKIGVGILEKQANEDYHFNTAYKIIKPGNWSITKAKTQITFEQILESDIGFAYHYTKEISLNKNTMGFSVRHNLKNTGRKNIDSCHYCHNFFKIDKTDIGKNYVVRFPFQVANLDNELFEPVAKTKGNKIIFLEDIRPAKPIFSNLAGFESNINSNQFAIENIKSGAALNFQADNPIAWARFYATVNTICPELAICINLKPGQQFSWQNQYSFYLLTYPFRMHIYKHS